MTIVESFQKNKDNCEKKSLRHIEFRQKACTGYEEIATYLNNFLKEFDNEEKKSPPKIEVNELAKNIALHTKGELSVLNNKENWEYKTRAQYAEQLKKYKEKAKEIDNQENEEMKKGTVNKDKWELDSGLMAMLVQKNKGGNCDDLASYALNQALKEAKWCVAALVQNGVHSFVLLSSTQKKIYYLDIWVPEKRFGDFPKSFSHETEVYCAIVRDTNFTDTGRDLIKMYNERKKENKVDNNQTPRFDQVGIYEFKEPPF